MVKAADSFLKAAIAINNFSIAINSFKNAIQKIPKLQTGGVVSDNNKLHEENKDKGHPLRIWIDDNEIIPIKKDFEKLRKIEYPVKIDGKWQTGFYMSGLDGGECIVPVKSTGATPYDNEPYLFPED